jgi:hypothetical protein
MSIRMTLALAVCLGLLVERSYKFRGHKTTRSSVLEDSNEWKFAVVRRGEC